MEDLRRRSLGGFSGLVLKSGFKSFGFKILGFDGLLGVRVVAPAGPAIFQSLGLRGLEL